MNAHVTHLPRGAAHGVAGVGISSEPSAQDKEAARKERLEVATHIYCALIAVKGESVSNSNRWTHHAMSIADSLIACSKLSNQEIHKAIAQMGFS